jgi:hypothetical protein
MSISKNYQYQVSRNSDNFDKHTFPNYQQIIKIVKFREAEIFLLKRKNSKGKLVDTNTQNKIFKIQ